MIAGLAAAAALAASPAPRPAIVQDPVPFGARRVAETRAYAERHYGLHRARLLDPHVIVIHFTGSTSYAGAHATFSADVPDVELHELPGLCAHFIVDRDGTIRQQVSLKLMCRHTVGSTGRPSGSSTSAPATRSLPIVVSSTRRAPRALAAGPLRVTTANVIGHAESLSSPYHRERVARLRRQTHGDFTRASMRRYRGGLG